eukprot:CAMPEP_0115194898 /NCGR_PEP_ID=MMETSP0270-20121206/14305_1 /TAXON_ID=71861 /ORGANISM="Scrippsiella trochoidea, Strain CCMP3099" /LENGTH=604 /DNA_ID=CAMNT_0002608209 /DNA_START=145 /DNA_END=1959 /DNA_ORIENTATION=-
MAFNRYFDGVLHVKAMLSKWRDAFCSLCVFIEASALKIQEQGAVEIVCELAESKARLVHWFSVLTAIVVQKLTGVEGFQEGVSVRDHPDDRVGEKETDRPMPTVPVCYASEQSDIAKNAYANSKGKSATMSFRRKGKRATMQETTMQLRPPFTCCEELRKTAVEELGSDALVLGGLTPEELKALGESNDEVLCVLRWLLLEISGHAIAGRLLIAPPILSRVYQELSNGMLHYFMAMKIVLVPFPFPFAQFLQYALILFIVFCPFAVLPSLEEPWQGLEKTWPALLMNFLACAGFVALNEIAVELEEPFGDDGNDYPLHQEQWNIVWAIEDCYFCDTPRGFNVSDLGQDALRYVRSCTAAAEADAAAAEQARSVAKVEAAAAASTASCDSSRVFANMAPQAHGATNPPLAGRTPWPSNAPASGDLEPLMPSFQALRDLVVDSVSALQGLGTARHHELAALSARLRTLAPSLTGAVSRTPSRAQASGDLPGSDHIDDGACKESIEDGINIPAGADSIGLGVVVSGSQDPRHGPVRSLNDLVQQHNRLTRSLRLVFQQAEQSGRLHRGEHEVGQQPFRTMAVTRAEPVLRVDPDCAPSEGEASVHDL